MNEMLRRCIAAATHAPSKHNAQPWRFEIVDGVVELHADGSRAMPVSDPSGRELVIGCGAALYALRLAMRCEGHEPVTAFFPDGPDFSLLARVAAGGHKAPSVDDMAMREAIAVRHTDRGPLDADALEPGAPFVLQDAAEREGATLQLLTTPGLRQTLATLIGIADRAESQDPAFEAELRAWVRDDDGEADGIPLGARGPGAAGSYRAAFVQRDFDVTGDVHRAAPAGVDRPLPAILWTDGDHPLDWLRAGMALEAVLLRATVLGASASFLNQPLELPATRARLRHDLALPGFPQMILRLGVGADGAPSPRRSVEDVATWA